MTKIPNLLMPRVFRIGTRTMPNNLQKNPEIYLQTISAQKEIKNRSIHDFFIRVPLQLTKTGNFLLATSLKHKILKHLMIINSNYSSFSELSQTLRVKFSSIFDEDILRLSDLCNQNIAQI